MSTVPSSSQDNPNSALSHAWGKYRVYAATSRKRKAQLTTWRLCVLTLGIGGAISAVLCQQSRGWELGSGFSWLPTALGLLSAIALGLAAFFGKEVVSPDQERVWIRSRSIAEALKGQIYLFLTNAPPYNTPDKNKSLLAETEKLLDKGKDLQTEQPTEDQKRERLPTGSLTVQAYIEDRVNDQIEGFYRPRARELAQKMARIKRFGFWLGLLAVVLAALGSITNWTAGWVAVITTITASIAAYAYAGRYQYLIISYQATADKLELERTRWDTSGKTDADAEERNQFILDCEEVISIENSAWMAEVAKEYQQTKT